MKKQSKPGSLFDRVSYKLTHANNRLYAVGALVLVVLLINGLFSYGNVSERQNLNSGNASVAIENQEFAVNSLDSELEIKISIPKPDEAPSLTYVMTSNKMVKKDAVAKTADNTAVLVKSGSDGLLNAAAPQEATPDEKNAEVLTSNEEDPENPENPEEPTPEDPDPEEPAPDPEEPAPDPEKPAPDPEKPAPDPDKSGSDKPDPDPEEPAPDPDNSGSDIPGGNDPDVSPSDPDVSPSDPDVSPSDPDESPSDDPINPNPHPQPPEPEKYATIVFERDGKKPVSFTDIERGTSILSTSPKELGITEDGCYVFDVTLTFDGESADATITVTVDSTAPVVSDTSIGKINNNEFIDVLSGSDFYQDEMLYVRCKIIESGSDIEKASVTIKDVDENKDYNFDLTKEGDYYQCQVKVKDILGKTFNMDEVNLTVTFHVTDSLGNESDAVTIDRVLTIADSNVDTNRLIGLSIKKDGTDGQIGPSTDGIRYVSSKYYTIGVWFRTPDYDKSKLAINGGSAPKYRIVGTDKDGKEIYLDAPITITPKNASGYQTSEPWILGSSFVYYDYYARFHNGSLNNFDGPIRVQLITELEKGKTVITTIPTTKKFVADFQVPTVEYSHSDLDKDAFVTAGVETKIYFTMEDKYSKDNTINFTSAGCSAATLEDADKNLYSVVYTVPKLKDKQQITLKYDVEDEFGNKATGKELNTDLTYCAGMADFEKYYTFNSSNEANTGYLTNGSKALININVKNITAEHILAVKSLYLVDGNGNRSVPIEYGEYDDVIPKHQGYGSEYHTYLFEYDVPANVFDDQAYIYYYLETIDLAGKTDVFTNYPDGKDEAGNEVKPLKYFAPIEVKQNGKIVTKYVMTKEVRGLDLAPSTDAYKTIAKSKYVKKGDNLSIDFECNHNVWTTDLDGALKEYNVTQNTRFPHVSFTVKGNEAGDTNALEYSFALTDEAGQKVTFKNSQFNEFVYYAPIEDSQVSLATNNNGGFVRNGGTLSVKAVCGNNHVILDKKTSISFQGKKAEKLSTTYSNGRTSATYSYVIPENESKLKQGSVTYSISMYDMAGNKYVAQDLESNVFYDRVAPTATFDPFFEGFTNDAVTLVGSFVDDGGRAASGFSESNGVIITINGERQSTSFSNGATAYKHSLPLTEDGSYEITIQAVDRAGNVSEPSSVKVVRDATAPVVTVITPEGTDDSTYAPGVVLSDFVDISEDNLSDIYCKVTDLNGTEIIDINDPITTDGKKSVYILVTDLAGNTSAALAFDIIIDATAPLPVAIESISNTAMEAGTHYEFTGEMALDISLKDIRAEQSQQPDAFKTLKLVDKDGNVVHDFLLGSDTKEGPYSYVVENFGEYTLKMEAEDHVVSINQREKNNTTGEIEYTFTFNDWSLFQKIANNPVLLYSICGGVTLGAGALVSFLFYKKKKKAEAK